MGMRLLSDDDVLDRIKENVALRHDPEEEGELDMTYKKKMTMNDVLKGAVEGEMR